MNIRVNNIQKEISDNSTIEDLLLSLEHTQNGIAVAINEEIVSKEHWGQKNASRKR